MTGEALLCACLRMRHDASALPTVRAAAATITDWTPLLAQMERERITPILHRTLGSVDVLPTHVLQSTARSYRFTALRNLLMLHALTTCLEKLAAEQIPVIVLKGAALAEVIYENIGLRPMSDVDLLVRPADVDPVRKLLEGLGYTRDRAETHPGALTEHENELSFSLKGQINANMDVHWSLFDSPYYQDHINMQWFWETAELAQIAKTTVLMLGPEAQVIHLCGHLGLHHQAEGLLWWQDIVEVIVFYRERIDWDVLLARTREFGLVLPVRTVLQRLADEWHAPIPDHVLGALEAASPSQAEERVFSGLSALERPAGHRFLSDLSTMPSWRQRLRFARTNLFPSAAYMRQRYHIENPLLLPFYYPYRWLRGLRGVRGG